MKSSSGIFQLFRNLSSVTAYYLLLFISLTTSIIILTFLMCTPPHNPFDDIDNVSLSIEVTEKPDKYNYCVNDKVRFKVTVLFADLVKKISIHFDENGDRDEREISANVSNKEVIFFEYRYKEKDLKEIKFTITFRQSGEEKDTTFKIDIGVKPTIRNNKNLLAVGDIIPGKSLILTANHEEFGIPSYQWYKNSKLIPGQDKQSLIFYPLKESDEGQYYCIVTTAWGKDQSKPFNLVFKKKIAGPPKIQVDPSSIQATPGAIARFSVRATGEMIEYQWQKNEVDISGANDSLYEVKDLKAGDSATYRCIVSNSSGKDTSGNAYLKVFVNKIAPKITKHPESQVVEEGDIARFSVESDGTDLKYKWFRNDKEIENAVLAVFETGPVSGVDNGKNYHCLVYNDIGEEVSVKVTLTVKRISKPVISVHPGDTSVSEGTPVMFTVKAEGKGLTYQWFENGDTIDQAVSQSYILKEAQLTDNGKKYRCRVSNSGGEVNSNEAILTVVNKIFKPEIVVQPKNQEVTAGKDARFLVVAKGGELSYQWQKNQVNIPGAAGPEYIHKDIKKEDNGKKFRCIVSNKAGQAISDEAVLNVIEIETAPKITGQPQNVTAKEKKGAKFSITAEGTNLVFQWLKNGEVISGEDKSVLTISSADRKDNGTKFSCRVKNRAGEVISDAAVLTVHYGPEISAQPQDIGIKLGEIATFSVGVKNGNPEKTNIQWYKDGVKLTGATYDKLEITGVKTDHGKKYSCKISNDAGFAVESRPAVLSVYYIEITTPPSHQSVKVGGKAEFKIIAVGNPSTLKYQWKKGGINVGNNSPIYTISNVDIKDNGLGISCIVSNGEAEPVSSNSVMLAVEDIPPTIKNLLSDISIEEGKTVTFLVETDGTNLRYQWQRDGEPINNARSDSYTFTVSSGHDGNKILCVVSNSAATKKSNVAKLTVLYRVTFKNDGSTHSTNLYPNGKSVPLPKLTKDGFEFKGWSDGSKVHTGDTYKVESKSITFTAEWKEIPKECWVTYVNNKNEINVTVPGKDKYFEGETVIVKGLEEPDICEWEFKGWEYSGSNKSLQEGESFEINNNVTLTTIWERYRMKDPDNNEYNCIKIGNLIWMQENYRYTGKTDEETGNDEWGTRSRQKEELHCYYNNDNSNSNKYGALYNWYATTANNFTPDRWRVATELDFNNLAFYFKEHENLKSLFFNVFGGYRAGGGDFTGKDECETLWSSTEAGEYSAIRVDYNIMSSEFIDIYDQPKTWGYSIRLVQDK